MSSLLRATLDNMNEKLVPFLSEYKICQNYMYLESLRFSDKFDYEFEPIKNMTVEQWMIPPGIIEPFLENAVNHAFTGVKQKGKITLHHKIEDNKLIITVQDNGIGMKVSPLKNKKRHGLRITKDYIDTVSKLYKSPIKLKISSKKGTTIILSIPKLNPYIVA
ncbi:MAG: ATP-binding protein [Flavobacteriaceae bacterium]